MKKFVIALMIAQIILFCLGVCFLLEGKIAIGLFIIIGIFFVNVDMLKRIKITKK